MEIIVILIGGIIIYDMISQMIKEEKAFDKYLSEHQEETQALREELNKIIKGE